MANKIFRPNFEFRRRIDGVVYYFHQCDPIAGQLSWKREDDNIWITYVEGFGWVCIDNEKVICGVPWCVPLNKMGKSPPKGEWISKKGDKSYVYDLIY